MIPTATAVELEVAASCALSANAARACARLLSQEDFYDRRLARIYAAACELDRPLWLVTDPRPSRARLGALSVLADEPLDALERLVYDHATFGTSDPRRWCERISKAAERRRALERIEAARALLEAGADVDDVRPLLHGAA